MATAAEVLAPLTEQEERRVYEPEQEWSNTFALKVVRDDFSSAESDRTMNHDARWRNASELYLAWAAGKTWEGTKVPRANIPVFLAFKQIESLMPRIMGTIFGDDPWAEADPEEGTTPEEARLVRDLILKQFDDAGGRSHIRRAAKSALILGNGIVEAGWEYGTEKKVRWAPFWIPQYKTVRHPLFGTARFPTGEFKRKTKQIEIEETISKPFLRYVSLKDFYIDLNCESPSVQDARFAVVRRKMSIDTLLSFADEDGFTIPSKDELIELARKTQTTQGELSKQAAEAYRGISWNPAQETSVDPASTRLEVLAYATKERVVWLLNREKVIYNRANDYGMIPYFNAFYVDVLDRFYGLALTDVVEGDQRLSRALIEARVDEISLGIHRARIKRQGINIPAYQMKRRPGQVIEAANPKEDIVTEDVLNISQPFYLEVSAAEMRSQQTTGVSDLAMMGGIPSEGNAASRTATGVNVQANASGSRQTYVIENQEYEFLEPILNFLLAMNHKFRDPDKGIPFRGQMLDPVMVMNSQVRFRMRAAARSRSRTSLQQALPLIMQAVLHPGLQGEMSKLGQKLNVQELSRMIMDATDQKSRDSIWIEMTPEERQALNQPPPAEMLRMQMQRERIAGAAENTETKSMSDLFKEIIKGALQSMKEEGGEERRPA